LGAIIFTVVPEILRSVEEYQWIVYGLILMLCIVFLPNGIVGWLRDARRPRRDLEPR